MAKPLLNSSVWSVMLARSGAKADWAPVCLSVVTAAQPQPPGTQVATAEAKLPSPLSKPSVTGVLITHGVAVGDGVTVAVGVFVAVRGHGSRRGGRRAGHGRRRRAVRRSRGT